MASGEDNALAKSCKQTASSQEALAMPSYHDWAATHLQAFYGAGAASAPFFTSPHSSSTTPNHYIWRNQHLIPSSGTPLPYPVIYPHGFYPHPKMAASAAIVTREIKEKVPDGKDSVSKKSKGCPGNMGQVDGKSGVASGSGNDGVSQSAEGGSEASSYTSGENTSQQESTKRRKLKQMPTDGENAQNNHLALSSGAAAHSSFNAYGQRATKLPVYKPGHDATMSATNSKIGMDLWNASPAGAVPSKVSQEVSGITQVVAPATMAGLEGAVPDPQSVEYERELRRQRRKQSNRESARRSRLRKQAEGEELQTKVEILSNENHSLNTELKLLSEECQKLGDENASIEDELQRLCGSNVISTLRGNHANLSNLQSANGERNYDDQETLNGSNAVSAEKQKLLVSNGNHEPLPT